MVSVVSRDLPGERRNASCRNRNAAGIGKDGGPNAISTASGIEAHCDRSQSVSKYSRRNYSPRIESTAIGSAEILGLVVLMNRVEGPRAPRETASRLAKFLTRWIWSVIGCDIPQVSNNDRRKDCTDIHNKGTLSRFEAGCYPNH